MTKNTFKYLSTVLISLILFSLVTCIAVFGVLSVKADDGAFAEDLQRVDQPDPFTEVNDLSDRVELERDEIRDDLREDIVFDELRSEEQIREVSDWQPDPNATYMFNQLVYNGNFTSTNSWQAYLHGNLSAVNHKAVLTFDGSVGYLRKTSNYPTTIRGHIYLVTFSVSFSVDRDVEVLFNGRYLFTRTGFIALIPARTVKRCVWFATGNGYSSDFLVSQLDESDSSICANGESMTIENFMIFDLTSMGLDQITSYDQFAMLFPSQYYPYTPLPGTMITPSYDAGYNDGLVDGYQPGYNAGYANGLLEINSNTFISDRTTWRNYESNAPFISSNGVITQNNRRWDVGYTDLFVTGNINYQSFSYGAKYTLASYNNQLNYTLNVDYYVFGEDPNTNAPYIGLLYEDSFIQFSLVMFEDYSDLTINILNPSGTSFYTLNNSDLYKFTVMRINDSTTIFDAGAEYADSRLNESSVSYATGYNRGVEVANHYTFYSLIDAVILSPITMISRMLDFNILGVNMRQFFMSLLTIALVLFIFKLFLAGGGSSGGSAKS